MAPTLAPIAGAGVVGLAGAFGVAVAPGLGAGVADLAAGVAGVGFFAAARLSFACDLACTDFTTPETAAATGPSGVTLSAPMPTIFARVAAGCLGISLPVRPVAAILMFVGTVLAPPPGPAGRL